MSTYNISVNKELATLVDEQVKIGRFANRSEFFRQALRHLFFSREAEHIGDWLYTEPYYSELKKRVKRLKEGKEKIIDGQDFDKEFNL